MDKYEEEVTIVNKLGMHARPAALLTKEAQKHACEVLIIKDGMEINAKSIMNIMMLAAGKGTLLKIIATGNGAKEAVQGLVKIINDKFYED